MGSQRHWARSLSWVVQNTGVERMDWWAVAMRRMEARANVRFEERLAWSQRGSAGMEAAEAA